jgi:cellulose synthase/poly-beta-1,6-N-acetylglucosamine synthase-like glycosyltransferase
VTAANYGGDVLAGALEEVGEGLAVRRVEAKETNAMLIPVIIPAFNEEKILGQTLDRIKLAFNENQNNGLSWEIIVCYNNSIDRSAEIASQKEAKLAFEPINQISRARNTGAGIAQLGSKLLGTWYSSRR